MQRSLAKLRGEGFLCAIVEHWNQYAHIRQDLFGFGDILAVRANESLIVQTTSGPHVAERIEKIRLLPSAKFWCQGEHRRIVVHGWAKRGDRGKRKLWTCREVFIGGEDMTLFEAVEAAV